MTIKTITKYLLIAAAVGTCVFAGAPRAHAQTATFIYNDGVGTPNQGTYSPGQSFTFSINLAFTPGGNVSNLEGLSYWFQQKTPAGAPFYFAITNRDASGSMFTDLQTSSPSYPQNLNPSNPSDLGALIGNGNTPLGAGTYFVANITVSISASAAPGEYTIDDVLTGGKKSVITDMAGHTFGISEADYIIDVVPEPATWLTPILGVAALLFTQRRRIFRLTGART
jgi:hypothetical protein